jgi:large subunit ribosomal protein L32
MAVPKKRTSKQRKHTRRANWKLALPGISECPQCHKPKLSHRVCKSCGYYDGKQIIKTEQEEKAKK